MKYNINITIFKKDEICSIDDKMIKHIEEEIDEKNIKNLYNKLNFILEKYKSKKEKK